MTDIGFGPLPTPDPDSAPFWAGTRAGKLLVQLCRSCGKHQFYPRLACAKCFGEVDWVEASGMGRVYSFTVVHRAPSEALQARVPYVVALIDLDEGVRMMSMLKDVAPEKVTIGMSVRVVFERASDEITLPHFTGAA